MQTAEGFGFNVMGGKEQKCPIYISRIIPGGYADRFVCISVCVCVCVWVWVGGYGWVCGCV